MGPDGAVYAVTSGIFEEAVVHVDPTTLLPTVDPVASAFQGVAADKQGNVWVAGGPANAVFQYKSTGPALVDVRQAPLVPDAPNNGIPASSYPGTMLLDGQRLFVSGSLSMPSSKVTGGCPGGSTVCSVVNVIDVGSGDPTAKPATHTIAVGRDAYGLAYLPQAGALYVANWADHTNPNRAGGSGTVSVVKVNPDGSGREQTAVAVGREPTGLALSPDHRLLVVADADSDQLSVLAVNPATGALTPGQTISVAPVADAPLGIAPLSVAFSPDGSLLYVSLSGLNAVEVLSVRGTTVSAIPQRVTATFNGAGPRDVRVPATYIPTGWYPDAVAIGPEPAGGAGSRLYVANLRGQGAGPGHYDQLEPLVGDSTEGTLSAIDVPTGKARDRAFNAWTAKVVENDQLAPLWAHGFDDPASDPCAVPPNDQVGLSKLLCPSRHAGAPEPNALHVVYIEAENKTFDSYFGDIGPQLHNANASPAFAQYGAAVTTNQHNLAEQFALSDNVWNEGAESSVLGHSWLSGSYTTPDNELTWGQSYDQGLRGNRPGGEYGSPAVGPTTSFSLSGPSDPSVSTQEDRLLSPRQVLADEAVAAGLSVRDYGTDVTTGDLVQQRGDQFPENLWGEAGSGVSTDLAWPDVDRAQVFLHGSTTSHAFDVLEGGPSPTFGKKIGWDPGSPEWSKWTVDGWSGAYNACTDAGGSDASCQASMPNFTYMELPENHTYDVSNVLNPLDPTPQSMIADNDYAIGQIIEGLSKSPFWKNTVVFLTEDDNQFTGDHVDIHRTFLLTMGGMARQLGLQGKVAKETGSFASINKTSELLLGLPPLTFFDWRAAPLHDVLANRTGANSASYTPVCPPTPFLAGDPSGPVGPCAPTPPSGVPSPP
ncbi:MAG: bifunctional YncE family protein/alkaline phosphatase family protein [Acidimicrobiia bacterium]|nr:bifunctional YncE family protein/alkaline phosphatase family protein [Acidimicrobiia bacterium]